LCERLVDLSLFDISIGKRRLPRVSVKEFREVTKLMESKLPLFNLCSDSLDSDLDREAIYLNRYEGALGYVLRLRIRRLSAYLVSQEFIDSISSRFTERLLSRYVIKDKGIDMKVDAPVIDFVTPEPGS
jgi:hypothetical protein